MGVELILVFRCLGVASFKDEDGVLLIPESMRSWMALLGCGLPEEEAIVDATFTRGIQGRRPKESLRAVFPIAFVGTALYGAGLPCGRATMFVFDLKGVRDATKAEHGSQ